MKKRKLGMLLAVVMVLVMVISACGSSGKESTDSSTKQADTSGTTSSGTESSSTTSSETASSETTAAENAADSSAKDWPSEITMFLGDVQKAPVTAWETEVGKKIAELTGVKLNIEYLVGQDIMTKANLMVASGVYPDIIYAGDNSGIFIAGEALIPLDDLINQHAPNISRIYRPKELELSALQNGKIYVIPTNRPTIDNLYPAAGYYLGYDVLKQAGFPVVKSINQYRDIIINYIENNPTYEGKPTIGFTLPTEGSRASALEYGGARFLSGFPNDGVTQVNQDTLEANIVMLQPSTRAFLEFCNEMWNLGYMDPDTFMQKDDEYLAKIASGRVVGLYDQRWAVESGLAALEASGKDDRNLVAFPVVMEGVSKEYYRGPYAMAVQGLSISSAAKDPEGIMRFLNRLAEDDIQKLHAWGIEGVDYSLDSDGNFQRTEEQWLRAFDMEYRWRQGLGEFTNIMPRYEQTNDEVYGKFQDGNWVNPNFHPDYINLRYKPYEKQIVADYNAETLVDWFAPAYPARYMPGWAVRQQMPQDSDEFIAVNKALETAREWHTRIIQAPAADFGKLWDEYQALLRAIPGLENYEKEATRLVRESANYY